MSIRLFFITDVNTNCSIDRYKQLKRQYVNNDKCQYVNNDKTFLLWQVSTVTQMLKVKYKQYQKSTIRNGNWSQFINFFSVSKKCLHFFFKNLVQPRGIVLKCFIYSSINSSAVYILCTPFFFFWQRYIKYIAIFYDWKNKNLYEKAYIRVGWFRYLNCIFFFMNK